MTGLDLARSPEVTRIMAIPGQTITLADGQSWNLALPAPRYQPVIVPRSAQFGQPRAITRLVARIGYPWAIERLVEELRSACRAETNADGEARRFDALISLTVALLRRAHDLSLCEAVALLDLDDAGLIAVVDTVLAMVAGLNVRSISAPNVLSDGGGDACPP